MEVVQLYTGCLSEAAYFIASGTEAAVIDPLRDIDTYLEMAAERGVTIKYVFETHFHADFVSGHIDLSNKTGAPIVYGPDTVANFPVHVAKDGERFKIGAIEIEAVHTPGHTLESTCYLLRNEQGEDHCIFTGDTLFIGDVGRPDLFSGNLTKEELASKMYHSLRNKIMPLADSVIVYPAHGPGSACGKNLGPETVSTIGKQKETNYALQEQTEAEFITAITTGLNTPPAYFPINAGINKKGYDGIEEVYSRGLQPLNIAAFKQAAESAWILDTRHASVFTNGFVPDSISIGLEGRFAEWAGILLPAQQPLLLVTDPGKEKESITRLARVGIDNVIGYLDGGFEAWQQAGEPVDVIVDVEPDEFAMDIPFDEHMEIVDVRKPGEFAAGHVVNAINIPLDTLTDMVNVASFEDDKNVYIHCAGGYRSVIAASLLRRQGFANIRNVLGGYGKIKEIPSIRLELPEAVKS